MHPVIAKTFGGLSRQYYLRQLFFGSLFPLLMLGMVNLGSKPLGFPPAMVIVCLVNTLLYPYSRFVYEGVVGFIMGNNVLYGNAFLFMFFKYMTMALCWGGAIFIAPVGLIYLYFHHSKNST